MPIEDRDRRLASKRWSYHRNREKRLAYAREYHAANRDRLRERHRAKKARYRADHRARANALKLTTGCIDCGLRPDDASVLHFDHVEGDKVLCLSDMIAKDWCWDHIECEIAKCVVRCGPCHRARHHKPVDW